MRKNSLAIRGAMGPYDWLFWSSTATNECCD